MKCLIFAALLLSACTTAGVKVERAALEQFKRGHTTYQEVLAQLGHPTHELVDDQGYTTLLYTYVSANTRPESFIPYVGALVGGADIEQTTAILKFDHQGVLESYSTSAGQMGSGTGFASKPTPRYDQPRAK